MTRVVTLLYFAWVREAIGTGEEVSALPDEVDTVGALAAWLASRSEGHRAALADPARLRAAIDQQFVPFNAAIGDAREIAFFPPVTGG
jgi:molybdopterin synthase sulfur carrier subunit